MTDLTSTETIELERRMLERFGTADLCQFDPCSDEGDWIAAQIEEIKKSAARAAVRARIATRRVD